MTKRLSNHHRRPNRATRTGRGLVPFVLVAALVTAGDAIAAERTLVVTAFGGNWERGLKEAVVKPFEKEHNVRVVVTLPGDSAEIMAKLRAEKNNPKMDVVLIGGGLDVVALKEGLLTPFDPTELSNYKDIYEIARNPVAGLGPSVGFAGVKLAYNTKRVTSAPTSWEALWDERYKGRVGMMNMSNNGGIMLLYLMSMLNGGSIDNTEPGFKKLATLKANKPYFFESNPAAVDMFVQERLWISPMFDGRVAGLVKEGFPIRMTCPVEGCFVTHTYANLVAGSQNADLAKAFINKFISAEAQGTFATISGSGPVNKKTTLAPEVAQNVIYGPDEVAKLISLPWSEVNSRRDQWVERWNREILAK